MILIRVHPSYASNGNYNSNIVKEYDSNPKNKNKNKK